MATRQAYNTLKETSSLLPSLDSWSSFQAGGNAAQVRILPLLCIICLWSFMLLVAVLPQCMCMSCFMHCVKLAVSKIIYSCTERVMGGYWLGRHEIQHVQLEEINKAQGQPDGMNLDVKAFLSDLC